jgi:hypothetical protein
MAALSAKNEKIKAVGNVLMNARGDRLNADGTVRYTVEELARMAKNNKIPDQTVGISDTKPIASTISATQPAQETSQDIPVAPTPSLDPQPISKITRTREDGSKYMEIEYDDGSIETQEVKDQ